MNDAIVEPGTMATRKLALTTLLFALVAGIYLLSGKTFLGYDGEITYRMSESLVLRHTVVITDPIYHTSQPYSPYGVGLSLLLVPLTLAGWVGLHDPRALITLLQPAVTAAEAVVLMLLLIDFGSSYRHALGIALLFAFGTLAWHYSGVMFAEPAIGLTAVLSLLWLYRFARRPRRWLLTAAGTALGIAVLMRWDALPLEAFPLAAYGGWYIWRQRVQLMDRVWDAAAFAAPIVACVLINVYWDVVRFGHLLGGPQGNHGYGFNTPLIKGVFGLLLSPGAGLVIYVPVVLIAMLGMPAFLRERRVDALLIVALLAVRLLVYGRWWAWEGGTTWGPRYLVPILPLLLIPIAFTPGRPLARLLTWAYGALGIGIQVLGQLVPFGLYYGAVSAGLVRALHLLNAAPDGTPLPGAASEAVNNMIDFNWIYAPIPVQIQLLIHGVIDPMWMRIWPLVIIALILALAGTWRMYRMAAALDRSASIPVPLAA